MSVDLKDKIQETLNKIRSSIQSHGGDVKLVSVIAGVVKLKIKGSCVGCSMAAITFGIGVEKELKKIKGVKKVIYS